jgi:hypothetical protein
MDTSMQRRRRISPCCAPNAAFEWHTFPSSQHAQMPPYAQTDTVQAPSFARWHHPQAHIRLRFLSAHPLSSWSGWHTPSSTHTPFSSSDDACPTAHIRLRFERHTPSFQAAHTPELQHRHMPATTSMPPMKEMDPSTALSSPSNWLRYQMMEISGAQNTREHRTLEKKDEQ